MEIGKIIRLKATRYNDYSEQHGGTKESIVVENFLANVLSVPIFSLNRFLNNRLYFNNASVVKVMVELANSEESEVKEAKMEAFDANFTACVRATIATWENDINHVINSWNGNSDVVFEYEFVDSKKNEIGLRSIAITVTVNLKRYCVYMIDFVLEDDTEDNAITIELFDSDPIVAISGKSHEPYASFDASICPMRQYLSRYLEIASDSVKAFGLIINDKNKNVTRYELYSALVHGIYIVAEMFDSIRKTMFVNKDTRIDLTHRDDNYKEFYDISEDPTWQFLDYKYVADRYMRSLDSQKNMADFFEEIPRLTGKIVRDCNRDDIVYTLKAVIHLVDEVSKKNINNNLATSES